MENGFTDENAVRMRVISEFQLHFWDGDVCIEDEHAQDRAQWCVEQRKGMAVGEFNRQLGHEHAVVEDHTPMIMLNVGKFNGL